jgi:glycosyltransferase involved in cell wall biosynthesis
MHIAIVSETWPPEVNGVALTVANLARGLRESGHRVDIVRPRQKDDPQQPDPGTTLVAGIRLPRYPDLQLGLPMARGLRCLWKAQRPDAVYIATEGPLGWSALRAAKRLGIAIATGFHTRFDDFAQHYGVGFATPLVFSWLRRFHHQADATLVPTIELRDLLTTHGFGNVVLLPRAVDTALFDPARRDPALRAQWGLGADQLAVIYVGRIAAEKNLDLAVHTFRTLQKHRPDARYVFVGDGPARAALARDNPDFLFCGVQRDVDLARHFASGDLFLFPSLTETFGNVILEALASGVPTVAFDCGAARAHVGSHCGRNVARADENAFMESTLDLVRNELGDPVLRERARAAVAGLDPASVCTNFATLLAGIAQTREKRAAAPNANVRSRVA